MEAVRLGGDDLDGKPAADLLAGEDRIDAVLDLFVGASTGPRAGQLHL